MADPKCRGYASALTTGELVHLRIKEQLPNGSEERKAANDIIHSSNMYFSQAEEDNAPLWKVSLQTSALKKLAFTSKIAQTTSSARTSGQRARRRHQKVRSQFQNDAGEQAPGKCSKRRVRRRHQQVRRHFEDAVV